MRPLEVVEQAPDEVSLHRRAVGDRAGNGGDMRREVRGSLGIVHAAVVDADVAERGAVLRDVHRGRCIVAGDPDEQAAETVGIDLPAHVRVLRLRIALHPRAVGAGAHDIAEVVVDAEEIQRGRDRLEIAVAHKCRDDLVALEEIRRVGAAEDRVEEPAVPLAVDLPRRRFVLGRVGGRIRVREVERDPDLGVRSAAPDRIHRPAVREQQVMSDRDRVGLARAAGGMFAPAIADPGVDPRFVVRDPVPDAVTEAAHDSVRVLDEGLRGRARRPAALVLERLRRVPVEERRERLDLVRKQLVDEAVVEVESRFVDRPATRR